MAQEQRPVVTFRDVLSTLDTTQKDFQSLIDFLQTRIKKTKQQEVFALLHALQSTHAASDLDAQEFLHRAHVQSLQEGQSPVPDIPASLGNVEFSGNGHESSEGLLLRGILDWLKEYTGQTYTIAAPPTPERIPLSPPVREIPVPLKNHVVPDEKKKMVFIRSTYNEGDRSLNNPERQSVRAEIVTCMTINQTTFGEKTTWIQKELTPCVYITKTKRYFVALSTLHNEFFANHEQELIDPSFLSMVISEQSDEAKGELPPGKYLPLEQALFYLHKAFKQGIPFKK